MKAICAHLFLWFLAGTFWLGGQISPGDLSRAHADLEGISNCTQCHELGEKVTDQKCLACHTEIQSLINRKSGYHANREVVRQDCAVCHSDHHGRNFDMVRFDQDAFDHNLTGYRLEGEHGRIECRDCHVSENIADREIRSRPQTFLGLEEACLSCHEDFHQATLSEDCRQCHDMEAFRPAPRFDHDDADFALRGAHTEVDCRECHAVTTRSGREFQEFTGLDFADCASCHEDAHNARLPGNCAQCHTESSFNDHGSLAGFEHGATGFDLRGSHAEVSCFACHAQRSDPQTVFADQRRVSENNCASCHADVHNGKFGADCASCHRESSFLSLKRMDFFDHSVTDYPLEGKHQGVDCRECHTGRFTNPIDFSACTNCHSDYHQGDFAQNGVSPDCVECHSLEKGFDYSLFTLEQHRETKFPLEGAHVATPCYACHVDEREERWRFRDLGSDCADCHEDLHQGFISESYYPDQACAVCHVNESWARVDFDHRRTDWPLDGKHLEVACRDCHFVENTSLPAGFEQRFATLSTDCYTCHENVHGRVFEVDGVTDCTRCHVTDNWYPKRFDHGQTSFPLEGQHAKIACSSCHEVTRPGGEVETVYKLGKFRCIDCHLQ